MRDLNGMSTGAGVLYVASGAGQLYMFDVAKSSLIKTVQVHKEGPGWIIPAGNKVYTGCNDENIILEWDSVVRFMMKSS